MRVLAHVPWCFTPYLHSRTKTARPTPVDTADALPVSGGVEKHGRCRLGWCSRSAQEAQRRRARSLGATSSRCGIDPLTKARFALYRASARAACCQE
eukprot:scaffold62029_cov36-Phaeocystis_antarctica.AAC.1